MNRYADLNLKDFKEIKSRIDESIYYLFLSGNVKYIESKNGYILFVGKDRYYNAFPLGDIDVEDLNLDVPLRVWYLCVDKATEYNKRDYIIDWDKTKIKKYKQKNSTDRIIKEQNLQILHNEYCMTEDEEFDELFNVWKKQTKAKNPINHKNYLSENYEKISYRINDKLVGMQLFEKVGNQIYFILNMIDYDYLSRSGISWIYPIEYFNCPIHYLGARNEDARLIKHKDRVCNENFISFDCIIIPSPKQCTEETRKERLNLLDIMVKHGIL